MINECGVFGLVRAVFFLKSFDFGVCSSSCKPKELSIFPFCVQRAQPYAVARVFEGKVLGHEVST